MVNAATPSVSGTVPSVAVPLKNVTLPVGVPVNSGATVAVKVTDSPTVEGFSDDFSVTRLLALSTV